MTDTFYRLFKGKFDAVPAGQIFDLLDTIASSEQTCEEFCSRSQAIPDDQLVRSSLPYSVLFLLI